MVRTLANSLRATAQFLPMLLFSKYLLKISAVATLIIGVTTVVPASADTAGDVDFQRAQDAFQRLAATRMEAWTYTRTLKSDGRTLVDRHDPALPGEEHWQLVSVDGLPPSEEDWREYRDKRANHADDKREGRYSIDDLAAMLKPGSLQLLATQGATRVFSFALQSPDGRREKLFAGLQGEMSLRTDSGQPFIEQLRIWSGQPVSPALGVKVSEFRFAMRFADHGPFVVPVELDLELEGRAFWFKDLGNQYQAAFSDHRPPARSDS